MLNFSRYKFVSLLASLTAIVCLYIVTFGFHKGFAHSLDFNGGLRAVLHTNPELGKTEIESFFTSEGISAVVILLDKEKNHYQVDIGLDAIPKILGYNERNPTENKKGQATIEEFISMIRTGLKLERDSVLSADQVGAIVGDELTSAGINLIIASLVIMTIYLSFRFKFKFALGASVALLHDLLFCIGFIGAFQIKPSIPLIAAILTLFGYSINDTIVIFDRIRENLSNTKVEYSLAHTINLSITQTLSRTFNTSFSTLIAVTAIILGGATELYDFAIVLIFGIFVGTYSSIFIAAPTLEIYEKFFPEKA
jgi:preprotein translocase subunit SecF